MAQSMPAGATKLTYEDFLLFPDDGKRHELIDGRHFMTPSPNRRHQRAVVRLGSTLHQFVSTHRLGEVYFAPFDVLLSEHDVVEPDLMFVSNERAAILTEANVHGAPDLVVEVLSPTSRSRDEVLKRGLYERAGVGEYWLVDPEAETVKILRREGDRFGRPVLLSLHEGDVLVTPMLPGLEIPLQAIFGD